MQAHMSHEWMPLLGTLMRGLRQGTSGHTNPDCLCHMKTVRRTPYVGNQVRWHHPCGCGSTEIVQIGMFGACMPSVDRMPCHKSCGGLKSCEHDSMVQVGDKLVQVSASFGEDVWDAGKFGQCMYAIKTRNGDLYFRFKKMYGDLSSFEVNASSSVHNSLDA